MTLSLCIIARNEEHNLGRAIRSFDGVADEIVVLDTGSTDGTIHLAESLGARVVQWPWRDDFSAARNEVFGHAQCEWIFLLDADEELLPGQEASVRNLIADQSLAGAWVLREDLRTTGVQEILQLRLFRKSGLPPQIGRCHPQFQPTLDDVAGKSGRHVWQSNLRLRHYGYLEEVLPSKLSRGRRLVELELQERPGQLYYLSELVRLKLDLGEPFADEFELAWAALEGEAATGQVTPNAQHLLEIGLVHGLRPSTQVEQYAAVHFSRSLPLQFQLARRAFASADFDAAIRHLECFDALIQADNYSRELGFQPRIKEADYLINLAVAYAQMGRLDDCKKTLNRATNDPIWGETARENLRRITSC